MLIQPTLNSPSVLDAPSMMTLNSKRYLDITFQDDTGNPVDIDETIDATGTSRGELELSVTNYSTTEILYSSYWPNITPTTRRIDHPALGKYRVHWGIESGESDKLSPLLFSWHVRETTGSEDIYRTQLVEIVSPKVLSLLPRFRLMLDKSIKVVVPEEYCTLGFSDSQLLVYLNMGLSYINTSQPYPTWQSLDSFPIDHGLDVLIKAALASALMSQTLFSIDTDIPSFSSQGNSFVITHAQQLKGVRDSLVAELNKQIREFKLQYVGSGSIGAEIRIGYGFYAMLNASPPGSLFRGVFSGGGGS